MNPLWSPSSEQIQAFNLTQFMETTGHSSYKDLYQWSLEKPEDFWGAIWDFCEVVGDKQGPTLVNKGSIKEAAFFPECQLNYAENLLQHSGPETALIFWGEDKVKRKLSWDELRQQVASVAAALKEEGLQPGDRVAGFVPNTPETIIAALATISIGAVWSSCSPDFGVQGVLDRFQQIEPKILFAANGYYYNGKTFSCAEKLEKITKALPTLKKTVVFEYVEAPKTPSPCGLTTGSTHRAKHDKDPGVKPQDDIVGWHTFTTPHQNAGLTFTRLPFNHPLFIMFSSGTTGKPKCIVHGAGGTLLQHLKEHQLHCDIKPGDRLFYFTTCGWMMWNWLISGLASKAILMLYDGNPCYPNGNTLFDYADAEKMTVFGTAAKFIDALHKEGFEPAKTHDLSSLRLMTSTGSVLTPESFDYVYNSIKSDIHLASISGGTDIVSCFLLGNPLAPVYRGQLQTPGLGMAVDAFNDDGKPCATSEKGELVCTNPFPARPLGFWNDDDGSKYHNAYYARYDNIWHHGDFVEKTDQGGFIIHGRSDAILNPGGVRIGTAEIYAQVEQHKDVLESVAIGQNWEGDVRVLLFVKLRDGITLSDELTKELKTKIRTGASPRHVPALIIQVSDIPKTRNGKISELAVRDTIHGKAIKNTEALANPESLMLYKGVI